VQFSVNESLGGVALQILEQRLNIVDSLFHNLDSHADAGLMIVNSAVSISNTAFQGCKASEAGALTVWNSVADIYNCTFVGSQGTSLFWAKVTHSSVPR